MVKTLALYLLILFTSTSRSLKSSVLPLSAAPPPPSSSPFSPAFLKEVVRAIVAKERWDPKGQIRVLELEEGIARIGGSQRVEFHVRVGRAVLVLRFSDEAVSWRRAVAGEEFGPSDLSAGRRDSATPPLELEGPLDLHVDGDDELSLLLPSGNITHEGLRRILVGDGITIKVDGAQEVSLVHPSGIDMALNDSVGTHTYDSNQFWSLGYSCCAPLLSVHVVGAASLVAYRTYSPEAYVESSFQADDTVELLTDKCYNSRRSKPNISSSFGSLRPRLALLKKFLRSYVGYRPFQKRHVRLLKAKITSSTLVKFRMELERDVTENDSARKKVAEWRTKPAVERHQFEIVARAEAGRGLKPLFSKKLKRPLAATDSTAWSSLMSNVSFTKFSSVVVPPEALTLDVKW